jgi:hypothetical protein
MARKKFTLVLKWTWWGLINPNPVSNRRNDAVGVAGKRNVTGPNDDDIRVHITPTSDGAIWKVKGEEGDIDAMIADWRNQVPWPNVDVQKIAELTEDEVDARFAKVREILGKYR